MNSSEAAAASGAAGDFKAKLASYRDLVLPTLLAVLPQREPRRQLYDLIAAHMSRAGKGLRPALCIATCRAFGGKSEDALKSAAALELLHNAFLVHDDIEDGSEYRRDRPTLHLEHGVPLAVNTGDAMNALSLRLLKENQPLLGPERTWLVLQEFDHMLVESLEGQAMELGWVRDNDCTVTEEDYLLMTLKKTCWYSFIHPCRIGALIARGDSVDLDRFNRFGFLMGTAFQIQDDVLNLVGDVRKYGKEIAGDLWEGKRTLILAHAFSRLTGPETARLRALLSKPRHQKLQREIEWSLRLLRSKGSIDYAREASHDLIAGAMLEFEAAYGDAPESEEKDFIRQCVKYMVARDL
ncbi:MAG: polyprenyl synthetase family protein [Deltaproteobacteria bacterium]